MTSSFYEQHQAIPLQLKTYWDAGEGRQKVVLNVVLKCI